MSKKETEFDRYDRMRKMQREAEVERKKSFDGSKKKGGRPKAITYGRNKNIGYSLNYDDYEY